jgi:hypothetical protein
MRKLSKKGGAAPTAVPRIEPDPIQPGDIVILPNGGTAAVEKIVGSDAWVYEWTKKTGRGPWLFPISDLAIVS